MAAPAHATTTSLTIAVSVDGATTEVVNPGQVVTFAIHITNSGTSDATNVTVTDPLPSGLQLGETIVPVGTYAGSTGPWNIGTLVPGEGLTATTVATVTGPGPSYTQTATASADNSPGVTSSATVDVNTSLAVVETVSAGDSVSPAATSAVAVDAGSDVTYQITASNTGASTATDVVVSDTLPAAFTVNDASFVLNNAALGPADLAANGIVISGGDLTWTIGSQAPGADATLSYTETTDAPSSPQSGADAVSISSTETTTYGSSDPATTSGQAYVEVLPASALGVTVSDGVSSVTPGGTDSYTIGITNNGPSALSGATVSDLIPSGFTVTGQTSSVSGTTFSNLGSGEIEWTGLNLAGGSSATLTVSGDVGATVAAGSAFVDLASLGLPLGATDSSSATTSTDADTVAPSAGTDISLSASPGDSVSPAATSAVAVDAGSDVTYQITASNTGASTATDVLVSDTLPAAFTVNDASFVLNNAALGPADLAANGIVISGGDLTWTIGSQAPGADATLSYTETTDAPSSPQAVPTNASISDGGAAVAQVEVLPASALGVTVSDGVSSVTPGGTDSYTIGITNNGPSALSGATVSDLIPSGFTVTGQTSSVSGTTFSNLGSGEIEWAGLNLAGGSSATLTVSGDVGATVAAGSAFVDLASLGLPLGATDSSSATTSTDADTVAPSSDLAVKVVDSGTLIGGNFSSLTNDTTGGVVTAGHGLVYTIIVSNKGPSAVNSIAIGDILPAGVSSDLWSVAPSGGAVGTFSSGTGNVIDEATLPSGAGLTYTVDASVSGAASLPLVDTATLTDTSPGDTNLFTRATDVLEVGAVPSVTSQAATNSPSPGPPTITDTVKLAGNDNDGPPTGSVTFYVCQTGTSATLTAGTCPASGTAEDAAEGLVPSADDTSATSAPFAPGTPGTWCFSLVPTLDSGTYGTGAPISDNTSISTSDPNECVLVAGVAPAITGQPVGQTALPGQTADFTAACSGFPVPVLQWQLSTDGGSTWDDIPGANSGTYTTPSLSASDSGDQYRLTCVNSSGAATSGSATLTMLTFGATGGGLPPSPPLDLTGHEGPVTLSWYPPASPGGGPVTGYEIFRLAPPAGASLVATVTTTSYLDPGVAPGVTYSYYVEAVNSFGTSPPSNVVSVTPAAPAGPSSACSPYSGDAAFICALYEDLLGRVPDPGGLAGWEGALSEGTSRSQVAYDIAESQEYRVDYTDQDYERFLGRSADPSGLATCLADFGGGATDDQVDAGILGSEEFFTAAGSTASGYITDLYGSLLARPVDPAAMRNWSSALAGGMSRTRLAQEVDGSDESHADLVGTLYRRFLNRSPDPTGLAGWVRALDAGTRQEVVVAGLTGSQEFYDEATAA